METSTAEMERTAVTVGQLRPLLGSPATVRTTAGVLRGTLLSCVRRSLWLVDDDADADVVVPLDHVVWVESAGRHVPAA
ncbi:MAG TPA: hypothetical protein VIL36_17755 [Acidimicrobiales bacterium]